MWVIDLENAPDRLRGTLSRWGVEVRAGLYVGSASGRVRDALWELVRSLASADTSAVMVFDASGPQGFEARTHGRNRREIVDMDGLWLARFEPVRAESYEPSVDELTDDAMAFDPGEIEAGYLEP
ncbi:MAG: type I-E CRISPR-associated endoribonuclease Cas2e [Deltaproteobacteria bacterium]|nr:type I-E CRISPR-associated endoribonuclease Cas2e [Deltaproteobacteria bacterium]